jgi:hypothetical protein
LSQVNVILKFLQQHVGPLNEHIRKSLIASDKVGSHVELYLAVYNWEVEALIHLVKQQGRGIIWLVGDDGELQVNKVRISEIVIKKC